MKIRLSEEVSIDWKVEKIGVIGPGIVGMPMASLLANSRIKIGTDQSAKVVVIQRNSVNSGWKDVANQRPSWAATIRPSSNLASILVPP